MFRLADDEWVRCCALIQDLHGFGPTEAVRSEIEQGISRIFRGLAHKAKRDDALIRTSDAAKVFREALLQLAAVMKSSAELSGDIQRLIEQAEVDHMVAFASQVDAYVYSLGREAGQQSGNDKKRGRPVDHATLAYCNLMLDIAKQERWVSLDDNKRISPRFMDLVVEVAKSAKSIGLLHDGDIRRALSRAMLAVRQPLEERAEELALIRAELDALGAGAQKMAASDPICLCNIPPKSV